MSHFAALVVRSNDHWKSSDIDDLDLVSLDDIEDVADLMRDACGDDGSSVLFVEEDDEWFGIVRVDAGGEPKAFISDARVVPTSELAAVLFGDVVPESLAEQAKDLLALDDDEAAEVDDEDRGATPAAEPAGANDLLADFGISGSALLAMCAEEGALPADVITSVCERLGCVDEIEVYR